MKLTVTLLAIPSLLLMSGFLFQDCLAGESARGTLSFKNLQEAIKVLEGEMENQLKAGPRYRFINTPL